MKHIIIKALAATLIISNMGTSIAYADVNNNFSNLNDLKNNIYEHLKNRNTTFSFSYTGSAYEFKNNISKTIIDAYSMDDYTERSWLEIKPSASNSGEKIDAIINVNYLTTKEEEDFVDIETKKIVEQIIKNNMTEIEKVRAINDYIINRYEYDYSYTSNNAYSALETGKAICQGYSMTAYKMLNYAGIQNRIIVGTVNGVSHSWNYVKIGESWYHVDITNNDSTRSEKYLLVGDSVLESNQYAWNKENY